jgi:hypothetical protein
LCSGGVATGRRLIARETKIKKEMSQEQSQHSNGPSWATMLVLLFLAIAVATGIAYWLIYPYIHRH